MQTDANLRPPGNWRNLKALLPLARPYRGKMILAGVFLLLSTMATLVLPVAVRQVIDEGFSASNIAGIDRWFWLLFVVVAILAVTGGLRYYFVSWLGQRLITDLRKRVYERVIRMSPSFFETTRTGEVLSRLNTDTTLVESLVGANVSFVLRNGLLFIASAVMLAVTSPKLAAIMGVMIPLTVLPVMLLGRRVRKLSRSGQDSVANFTAIGTETINAVQIVQSMAQEQRESERFDEATEQAFLVNRSRIRAGVLLIISVILLSFGGIVFVLWLGAHAVLEQRMTPGELGQFVLYALIAASAVGGLGEMWGSIQRAAGALERLLELLEASPDIFTPPQPQSLRVTGDAASDQRSDGIEVCFDQVSFAYPSAPERKVLDGLDFTIRRGETVALVGPSGAGKSTLIQLLLRFYDPSSGSILVNGKNLRELDLHELRSTISLVPQDTVIFSGDVRDNIRYGRPDATDAEILEAARMAHVDEFVRELSDGYDTFLGERGMRLSGGQRQRIAIARAVLMDPPLLLLDEATSSLDAESERQVQQAIESLRRQRSMLIIAHRLATVRMADRIVLLNRGVVEAIGSHDELIKTSSLYAHLAELQFMR
ncbi:MAG: ABC transporter ATP-binding protein/permease [Wenzhouxiangellaceae bacterium]